MSRVRRLLRPRYLVTAAVAGAVLVGFGLYWFQPWKLWQDETVREAAPGVSAPGGGTASQEPGGGAGERTGAAEPKALARGSFISHEHATRGSVQVLELADGSRVLRLTDLDTSNGPDLRVWITDAPVKEGTAGWRVFDDGKYVSLGKLKGNKGDQNYAIPADVRLDDFGSVSIWCDRFDVSFGAAELKAV
ncbi:DM13 domain-containing protein [Streptomyces indicus]|uniref:Electron transfer DM13 n=1 Tax=Streptomyces indicus TaxID=417292 RepID=A0A1G9CCK8_9ACTN|nr:DM13 domain-containing protein [Streptomyces indicus]SDK49326.1 Electron transfer DM13 [Streptomyces indicus]